MNVILQITQSNNTNQNIRHEPRAESSNVNMVPPISQNGELCIHKDISKCS